MGACGPRLSWKMNGFSRARAIGCSRLVPLCLANGQSSGWVAKLTTDQTVGSSATKASKSRGAGGNPGLPSGGGIAIDWVTERSGRWHAPPRLNVQSGPRKPILQ